MTGFDQSDCHATLPRDGPLRQAPERDVRALFLQGPPSPFARELGTELAARGAFVRRINLCIGDWVHWHDSRAVSYRGSLDDWEDHLADFVRRNRISDIIYFADRFPYHRAAQRVARRLGLNAISFEYGYLRPDWIICEPFGQSGYSHFPDDLGAIRAAAHGLPDPDFARQHSHSFVHEALGDTVHYIGNYLFWFLYPRFRRDRIYHPIREYLSYPVRFARARLVRNRVARAIRDLQDSGAPYFLVPLQMQNDYQIRANSPFTDQRDFLGAVLASFATHSGPETRLVIKPHPLDNGIEDWAGYVRQAVRAFGLGDRVLYLDGGDLGEMIGGAMGVITINSTSGMTALRLGCPVMVMGLAVYDIAGLTHQGGLDRFWSDPTRPDPDGLNDFLKVMAAHCHVRGDFYGRTGRASAIRSLADRIMAAKPFDDIFLDTPPRLARAREIGVVVEH